MAELKDLLPFTQTLSLLYLDEDHEILSLFSNVLKKIFSHVDDADNATLALGYLKLNEYDIVIVDSDSSSMSAEALIQNIKNIAPHQEILLTTKESRQEVLLGYYALESSSLLQKPFKASLLLDTLYKIATKLHHQRAFLEPKIEKLKEELLYERKRIGRFMLNEKKLEATIEEHANNINMSRNIYELTRLPNKNALQNDLDGQIQSLLYLNIDYFDFINTIYGMGKANKLLRACASQLKMFLPTNAKLYHITADEFVILLDGPAPNQDKELADQIQALFKESALLFDEYTHFVVFSIGIAFGEGKRLFVNGKAASKEARYYGGNNIVVYNQNSEYIQAQKENLYWIGALKKAFEEDRIINYYQPIVSNSDTQTKQYEVLCRLMDEDGKIVEALRFIESAKIVGLASQITKTVIDKAFKLFTSNEHSFSINITLYDLHEEYLVELLKYKCERYSISPQRVYLEIVEDILISKTRRLDEQVALLKEQGYHVIIDDFSSERSSYSRLFELQAEYIKIDATFIKELQNNKAYRVIVENIVAFARVNGMKTIAEHVESLEIHAIVKELGIDYSQGYFLAKPSTTL